MSYAASPNPHLTESVLWRRFWAWIVDFVVIAVAASILWVILAAIGVITLGLGFGLMVLIPILPLAYHVLFVASRRSATPGQHLLGLIVRRDADLGPPSLIQAALFTGGLWLTLSVGVWPLAIALFTVRNRALHDIVSGLVVVRSEALTPARAFANMASG